jgi:hypothetical protein
MRKLICKIDRRFQLSRPGSVLILVVALLVLMALIGTAFLSTSRVDRYSAVQQTNNAETDLLLEGVKNMAKATIVGSLNDPSLPFPYRPANSTIAKNWDAYDLYHQYTDDSLITTTPNDAWLSPRTPNDYIVGSGGTTPPEIMWSCIGEPLTGNQFESPIVLTPVSGGTTSGGATLPSSGQFPPVGGTVPLTYRDRMSLPFVPPLPGPAGTGTTTPVTVGSLLTPTFGTISYPDGTSATYPAFAINTSAGNFVYIAGDADGDGIADCGLFKLPVGQVNGLTYYAGVRIIDNCAAVNVNTAGSRRYDFDGNGQPTRSINGGTTTYNNIYNLGCFESNVGLAELLTSYNGGYPNSATSGTLGLGSEFGAWMYYHLGFSLAQSLSSGVSINGTTVPPIPVPDGVVKTVATPLVTSGTGSTSFPISPQGTVRADFAFTTLGDLLTSQIGRSPGNPGYDSVSGLAPNTVLTSLSATDTDAAALCYHFVFDDPYTERTALELALHSSIYDFAPNGTIINPATSANLPGPPTRGFTSPFYNALPPKPSATAYVGTSNPTMNANVVAGWYTDNFDWSNDFLIEDSNNNFITESCMSDTASTSITAGQYFRPRRSILTADSAVSNLTPQPALDAFITPALTASGSSRPINLFVGSPTAPVYTGMSPITSTLCKASINTASFADLWRAFFLAMSGDNGLSPLGMNSSFVTGSGYVVPTPLVNGTSTPTYDHNLAQGQSIYTGSQFLYPIPSDPSVNSSNQIKTQASTLFATPATYPQHPQAMFRSTLRTPNDNLTGTRAYYQSPGNWNLEADQMVILRSAIAAANATAMRYPIKGSAAPIFAYDVPLVASVYTAAGTPPTPTQTQVYARVYGVTQQPYITEVYVNTNISKNADGDSNTAGQVNNVPYVAVELFNPYSTPIYLAGWQLATVDRSPTSEANANRRNFSVLHTFGPADIVPAYKSGPTANGMYQGGYALLENFGPGAPTTYRPFSTNLPPTTFPVPSATNQLNDIVVKELGNVINDAGGGAPKYSNQELVLLRPIAGAVGGAGVAETNIDQVPVDSFDFTGLNYNLAPDPANGAIADVWHYFRGNAIASTSGAVSSNFLWRFIYPGRYDASDPAPYSATASTLAIPTPTLSVTQGSVVANEPRNVPMNPPYATGGGSAYLPFSRRQQGTQAGRFYPTASTANGPSLPIDPFLTGNLVSGVVTLGGVSTNLSLTGPNDNVSASYPISFPFQYLNNDSPGAFPLGQSPNVNAFPFAQFARNSDLLQVPYVGSYVIFSQAPSGYQSSNANSTTAQALSGSLPGNTAASGTDQYSVIEINALPMDCSFAEDTDITDDPPSMDTGLPGAPLPPAYPAPPTTPLLQYIWNESVGHFAPVNTHENGQESDNGSQYRAVPGQPSQTIADSDPTLGYQNSSDPYAAYKVQYNTPTAPAGSQDLPQNAGDPGQKYWRYHWASRIFDYLAVQNPNDDYFPNVQQEIYSQTPAVVATTPAGISYGPTPVPVQNSASISPAASVLPSNPNAEDTVPVYGLININTAPWRVLSTLRFCPFDDAEATSDQFTINPFTGIVNPPAPTDAKIPDNIEIAEGIANWRDLGPNGASNTSSQVPSSNYSYGLYKGPFTSLSDLMGVPVVYSYIQNLNFLQKNNPPAAPAEPDAVQGHLAPYDFYQSPPTYNAATPPTLLTDGVRNDTDERYDLLHRISNQCTVKSDVYTVYIVIQGWRNAGSTDSNNPPKMVTQKRAAFIIDRSNCTPTNSTPKIINVPTN